MGTFYPDRVLKPEFPIETERLLLRPYTEDDYDALYATHSRPEVARYLYGGPMTPDEAREALRKRLTRVALEKADDGLNPAVIRKDTGELIGDVLLIWLSEEHRSGEVGFVFSPDHHGHGFATEAAREMLRLGFEDLGLHRIIGRLDNRNTASGRVLERLGMRREAVFIQNEFVKGEWCDEAVWAMLETEWPGRSVT